MRVQVTGGVTREVILICLFRAPTPHGESAAARHSEQRPQLCSAVGHSLFPDNTSTPSVKPAAARQTPQLCSTVGHSLLSLTPRVKPPAAEDSGQQLKLLGGVVFEPLSGAKEPAEFYRSSLEVVKASATEELAQPFKAKDGVSQPVTKVRQQKRRKGVMKVAVKTGNTSAWIRVRRHVHGTPPSFVPSYLKVESMRRTPMCAQYHICKGVVMFQSRGECRAKSKHNKGLEDFKLLQKTFMNELSLASEEKSRKDLAATTDIIDELFGNI